MKKRSTLLVIDVGHSAEDKGARAPFAPYTTEWDYNLAVAGFMREKLTNTDSRVILRESLPEGYLNLPHRINQMGADLIISLHCNAAASPAAFGTEMICLPHCPKGRAFAEHLQCEVCRLFNWTRGCRGDRGLKPPVDGRGKALLENTFAPCVICEPFFLTNKEDHQRGLRFHEDLGAAYARAVDAFAPLLAA